MATGNEQATFSVVLDDQVSAPANEAADSVEALRDRMNAGERSVKEMSAALRRLRGSTVEVKQAKEQLKARIGATKDAISATSLAMLKQGQSAEKLAEKTRLATEGVKRNTEGLSSMKTAALGIVGVFAAVALAAVGAVVALGKFIVGSADAARSMNLMREAAAGSAANATALGSQVDALGRKVGTSKAALNELAVSMAKSGIQGQTLVDTLNAVGQANAALGDDAGAKLRELVDRGRMSQRFVVNPLELQGSGLQFDDIAKALSEQMHVGVAKAREALVTGRVKLGDGAAAMRKAVESKFGDINLRKMMSLEGLAETLRKRFASITSGVNLEPALKAVSKLLDLLDESTFSGVALREMVSAFGNGMVKAITLSAPFIKKFFQGMIIGALHVGIGILKVRNYLRKTFGDSKLFKDLDTLNLALAVGKYSLLAIVAAVGALGAALAVGLAPFAALVAAFTLLPAMAEEWGKSIRKHFLDFDWSNIGSSIVDGLIGGFKTSGARLLNDAKGLATLVKKGFTSSLGIQSPSKVFAGYGENTVEGFEQGVQARAPKAAQALDSMASQPEGGGRGGSRGAVSISMPVTIQVTGGTDAAKQLTDPNFLAQLTKALESVLVSAGVPVAT